MSGHVPQILSRVPEFAFYVHVVSCDTLQNWSPMPQLLPHTHHSSETPILCRKKNSSVVKSAVQLGGDPCAWRFLAIISDGCCPPESRQFLGRGGGGGAAHVCQNLLHTPRFLLYSHQNLSQKPRKHVCKGNRKLKSPSLNLDIALATQGEPRNGKL